MAEKKNQAITDFLADPDKKLEGVKQDDNAGMLDLFVKFLKERGQYVEPNSLREQFSEISIVRDKNRVPIEVSKCLVCGKEDFEVKPED